MAPARRQGAKTGPLLSHVRIQAIVLPRRARDKHRRESTPKRRPFCAGERAEIFRAGRRGSAGRPNWSAILGAMRGGARTSRVTGKTGCTKSAAPKGSTSGAERPAPTAAGSKSLFSLYLQVAPACNVMIVLSSITVPVALMTIGFWWLRVVCNGAACSRPRSVAPSCLPVHDMARHGMTWPGHGTG